MDENDHAHPSGEPVEDDTHLMRDKTLKLEFPRRASTVLYIGAATYALYRSLQTVVFGATLGDSGAAALDRVIVSIVDGMLMALSGPLALWASRRFPL